MGIRGLAAGLVLGLAVSGCGGASKFTLRGGISLIVCDGSNAIACQAVDQVQARTAGDAVGKSCSNGSGSSGVAGFSDIAAGTQVTVTNEKGALIATGTLTSGAFGPHLSCRFPFTISDVPGAKFYSIEVSHRGSETYSRSQLAAKHYDVELTLDASSALP